jgi:hypothetical protein
MIPYPRNLKTKIDTTTNPAYRCSNTVTQTLFYAKNNTVCCRVVDPDQHISWKLDPDPQKIYKLDQDSHCGFLPIRSCLGRWFLDLRRTKYPTSGLWLPLSIQSHSPLCKESFLSLIGVSLEIHLIGTERRAQARPTQCSVSGSTRFWASRIRIHQSEVWIRIILSSSKNSKKNLDFYCFVTSFGLLSLWKMI